MADSTQTDQVYTSGRVLAASSFITMLLILPPMFWHFRNRNIAATVLIAWLVILLLFNFINALLWPTDDFASWYNGVGLCDVEVKVQAASEIGLPSSLACILKALAAVMDTNRVTLNLTRAQKRRMYIIDLIFCLGFPSLQMILHYVVQSHRYYIFGISGCTPAVSDSWLTLVVLVGLPAIWVVVDTYFAVLIVTRLCRYRLSFSSILASKNTTRSRFIRLYLLCIIWILVSIPFEAYIVYNNATRQWHSYSWSAIHSAEMWREIILTRSNGHVLYDRYIPLGFGILVFLFFGFGKDAVNMYRSGLLAMRLDKCFPSLNADYRTSTTGTTSSFGSFGSKTRALFWRKATNSTSTSSSGPTPSPTSVDADPISPMDITLLDTVHEVATTSEKPSDNKSEAGIAHDVEKATRVTIKPSLSSRIFSLVSSTHSQQAPSQVTFYLAELPGEQAAVCATVSGGLDSQSSIERLPMSGSQDVVIRKEVRQGTEHGETPSATVRHAR